MTRQLRARAYGVSALWTLVLLYLGSVVHATESSLACPDWPTCFGTMVPEMSGGVFWEHLHRLVAGGLLMMWALATWITLRETEKGNGLRGAAGFGMVLLLIQAVFGGITVIYQLPDAISTSHLTMAFVFLALAVSMWARTTEGSVGRIRLAEELRAGLRPLAAGVVGLTFLQSIIGAYVRHSDAGMACPDVPLCRGFVIPPLDDAFVLTHFVHRVTGYLLLAATLWLGIWILRNVQDRTLRRLGHLAMGLIVLQVTLGFLSVLQFLAVAPVSLHTLGAALLVCTSVLIWTVARPGTVAGASAGDTVETEPAPHVG
jgi:heme A synthase